MRLHTLSGLLVAVFLTTAGAVFAQDAAAANEDVVTVRKLEDLPEELQQAPHVAGKLKQLLGKRRNNRAAEVFKLEDGEKLQLTIRRFFDSGHSSSTNKLEPHIAAIARLNKAGKKAGEEWFFRVRAPGPDRIVSYKNGVKHGVEKIYAHSQLKGVGHYVRMEIPWQNGEIHGAKKVYGTNAKLASEVEYVKGQQQGVAKSYGPKGNVVSRTPYQDGKKEGKAVQFYPGTDKIKREVIYKDDKINGVTKEYYANGKLKRRMHIKDGVMHGKIEMFAEDDGRLVRTMYYINGESVTQAEFKERFKE